MKNLRIGKNKRQTGTYYESLAVRYLTEQGVTILNQNYRCAYGEIDVIGLAPDNYLIFVEVKYRRSGRSGEALEAVDIRKQRTISKVAADYLKRSYGSMDVKCRFDVVGIEKDHIYWIQNAFVYQR